MSGFFPVDCVQELSCCGQRNLHPLVVSAGEPEEGGSFWSQGAETNTEPRTSAALMPRTRQPNAATGPWLSGTSDPDVVLPQLGQQELVG